MTKAADLSALGSNVTTSGNLSSASTLSLQTNSTTAVTINSSQNVGIGTSSPSSKLNVAVSSAFAIFPSNTSAGGLILQNTDSTTNNFSSITNRNSLNISTAAIGFINTDQTNSYSDISFATKGAAGITEKMRIDSSGNLGIGTTSPNYNLQINGSANSYLQLTNSSTGTANTDGLIIGNDGTAANIIQRENLPLTFYTNATERMRIDSSGNVLVATTSLWSSGSAGAVNIGGAAGAYTRQTSFYFCNRFSTSAGLPTYIGNWNSNAVFAIGSHSGTNDNIVRIGQAATDSNGAYWNGTYCAVYAGAYTNASDYRIKENVINYPNGALTQIINLRPVKYNIIANPNEDGNVIKNKTEIGFIAHEIQDVIPEVVVGEKDAIDGNGDELHQGLDYAKLTTVLVKAIQEQQTIINDLKARITALEGAK